MGPSWGLHGAHVGPTGPRWAPVGPMNLAIRVGYTYTVHTSEVPFKYWMRTWPALCLQMLAHLRLGDAGIILNS